MSLKYVHCALLNAASNVAMMCVLISSRFSIASCSTFTAFTPMAMCSRCYYDHYDNKSCSIPRTIRLHPDVDLLLRRMWHAVSAEVNARAVMD